MLDINSAPRISSAMDAPSKPDHGNGARDRRRIAAREGKVLERMSPLTAIGWTAEEVLEKAARYKVCNHHDSAPDTRWDLVDWRIHSTRLVSGPTVTCTATNPACLIKCLGRHRQLYLAGAEARESEDSARCDESGLKHITL